MTLTVAAGTANAGCLFVDFAFGTEEVLGLTSTTAGDDDETHHRLRRHGLRRQRRERLLRAGRPEDDEGPGLAGWRGAEPTR
ncbi:hypothetical protein G5V59_06855 [Nocardioides sp. W3-2-3]|uniref:hypothetical protein n=1 Tax=Nocardioides convexus TaxID=2712224 RepID=UPI0024185414|nr:hypothetical protein [Nocardioides convexus]NHA00025.1 hypothetical protein [Nocardioides convexus]